jgi:hypothetical protein
LLPYRIFRPRTKIGGVYWTKFETISGKIRRILTNDAVCASPALDKLARGKTQKFPIIFICGSPHTPRRKAEHLKGRKFLVLPPPLHSSKKANRYSLAFLPVLRPPFLRRLRRREAHTIRFALRRNLFVLCLPHPPSARTETVRYADGSLVLAQVESIPTFE